MKLPSLCSFLLLCCFVAATSFLKAQNPSAIFADSTLITWLGVDFSQVKVVGEDSIFSGAKLLGYFKRINEAIVAEQKKYDLAMALRREKVPYDLEAVTRILDSTDMKNLRSPYLQNRSAINEQAIGSLVGRYQIKNPKGIGLVFVMEILDKPQETGVLWATFFDLKTRKVLLTEKMMGKSGGFGFRNYWLKPVYEVIQQIKNKQYQEWKARYKK